MKVVDLEKSENGPQRRRHPRGRLLHCCCICGKLGVWDDGWSVFASDLELDESKPLPKFCSDTCRSMGGTDACDVTEEMKREAKDAEWRPPELAFREATEREKLAEAAHRQQRKFAARCTAAGGGNE